MSTATAGVEPEGSSPTAEQRPEHFLQCVSSGYLAADCSCGEALPRSVAVAAWARVGAHAGTQRDGFFKRDGFFRIPWQGQVWLAYGLKDGRVRGVYCPTHAIQRDERAQARGTRRGQPPLHLAA